MLALIRRKMKFQREADPVWADEISKQPGCDRIWSCIQCGTCSGTCPLSIYMDFTPRRIIALVREGFRADALGSQTIWLCASCYACAVRCPMNVHITDVMYSLKREAIKHRMYPSRFPIPVLAREFYDLVQRYGRSSEVWLVLRMAFKSNPLLLLTMARSGWDLLRTGRMSLRQERIKRIHELQRELASPQEVVR
jgi:quinone-modifying oxidoreductase, subunit QmoC